MFAQVSHMLTYALHTLAYNLLVGGRNGVHHGFNVGVVKHGSVHNAFLWQVVECVAAHFAAVDHDVVASAGHGIHSQPIEHKRHTPHVFVECKLHRSAFGDV